MELAVQENNAYLSMCSWLREIISVQTRPTQVNWGGSVACGRESLVLEARGCSTWFITVNWVCCLRQYCLPFSVSLGEEHHLCAKPPFSSAWKNHSIFFQRTLDVTSRRDKQLVLRLDSSELFKGILPTLQCFHGWGISALGKITHLKLMEGALCLS
jgi:hypothetical protein